jgi:hypothetical protein
MKQIVKIKCSIGWPLIVCLLILNQALAHSAYLAEWSTARASEEIEQAAEYVLSDAWLVYRGQGRNLPAEEKRRIQENLLRWQSLPPEKQQQMRNLMQQWRQMPPSEKKRYQDRFQQWQQLSPPEQQQMRNKLQRWNSLPENEKDRIRQQFRQ